MHAEQRERSPSSCQCFVRLLLVSYVARSVSPRSGQALVFFLWSSPQMRQKRFGLHKLYNLCLEHIAIDFDLETEVLWARCISNQLEMCHSQSCRIFGDYVDNPGSARQFGTLIPRRTPVGAGFSLRCGRSCDFLRFVRPLSRNGEPRRPCPPCGLRR